MYLKYLYAAVDKLLTVLNSKNNTKEKISNRLTVPKEISAKSGNIGDSLAYIMSKMRQIMHCFHYLFISGLME